MVLPRGPARSESIRHCRSHDERRRSFAIERRW
jgi:hypothetical protein